MKNITKALSIMLCIGMIACGESQQPKDAAVEDNSAPEWKLGVQLWTFKEFDMHTALKKADSANVRFVEAYIGQPLGFDADNTFGPHLSDEQFATLQGILQQHNVKINAFGVIVPQSGTEWVDMFKLARKLGVSYITAEPLKHHLDTVNLLAGEYGIPVAIHDHPYPNAYAHPDSVINAMKGREHLYACADIGHWARNGLDVVECLQQLEGRILGVHLKDVKVAGDTKAEDVVVGTGVVPVADVMAELKRQAFKGMFSIEREGNWLNNIEDVKSTKVLFDKITDSL